MSFICRWRRLDPHCTSFNKTVPSYFLYSSDGDRWRGDSKPRKILICPLTYRGRFMTLDRSSNSHTTTYCLTSFEVLNPQGFNLQDGANDERHGMSSPQRRAWHVVDRIHDPPISSCPTPTTASSVSPLPLDHAPNTAPLTLSFAFGLTMHLQTVSVVRVRVHSVFSV